MLVRAREPSLIKVGIQIQIKSGNQIVQNTLASEGIIIQCYLNTQIPWLGFQMIAENPDKALIGS